jgi:subtilisin
MFQEDCNTNQYEIAVELLKRINVQLLSNLICHSPMNKLKIIFFVLLIFLAAGCDHNEDAAGSKVNTDNCISGNSLNNGTVVPGEYIVSVSRGNTSAGREQSVAMILDRNNISSQALHQTIDGEAASYFIMHLSAAEVTSLTKEKIVSHVEPDRIVSMCGCFKVVKPGSVTWNVDHVGYGDGTGKVAWLIDSGVDSTHPDLNIDKTRSRSFIEGNSSYEDDNGHGTHVAGIIGALNNEIGILGVASGASIVALKVLDENGDGKLSSVMNALSYLRSNGKAGDVVNISAEFPNASQILEDEIQSIAKRGIFFTLAAGNDGKLANGFSPARTQGTNIYTVTAVDSLNRFADFSNYGNDVVDYAAPGVKILSTYTEGRYAYLSGTSMASPHVAGILLINNGKINSSGKALNDPDGIADPLAHQ